MLRLLKNWLDTALGEPGGIPEVEEDVLRARRLTSYQVFTISYKVLREFIAIEPPRQARELFCGGPSH